MPSKRSVGLALLVFGLSVLAPAPGAREYRPLPWHLADVWWTLESEEELREFSLDVAFENDLGTDVRLFIAPIGLVTLGETKAYGGFQTRARIDERGSEGMLIIFSRWGERRRDYVRPEPGGVWESAGYEGDFISVRKAYPWTAGRYVVRLTRLDDAESGAAGPWVRFRVCLYEDARCESAGALRFPDGALTLRRRFASFVEVYGPAIDPRRIPKGAVVVGNVRVNGKPARVLSATAYYPSDVPPYAAVRAAGADSVRFEFGEAHDRGGLPENRPGTRYQRILGAEADRPRPNPR